VEALRKIGLNFFYLQCPPIQCRISKVGFAWISNVKVWWFEPDWHVPSHLSTPTLLYSTQETKQAMYPPIPLSNHAWKERVLEIAANVLVIPSTRARPSAVDYTTVLATSVGADAAANPAMQESPNKRQKVENVAGTCSYVPESPEAYQLFRGPRQSSGDGGGGS
jgi:hypothetical protein